MLDLCAHSHTFERSLGSLETEEEKGNFPGCLGKINRY